MTPESAVFDFVDLGLYALRDSSACLDWVLTCSDACPRLYSDRKRQRKYKESNRRNHPSVSLKHINAKINRI